MTCTQCGAPATVEAGRFCKHCGARLGDAPRLSADEYRAHPERFARMRAAPGFDAALAHTPPRDPAVVVLLIAPILMMAFGAVFLTFWMSAAPGFMMLFGGVFGVAWFGGLLYAMSLGVRRVRAPLERREAVVIDKRTDISGGSRDSGASTQNYVTLQREDGSRQELSASGRVAGLVTAGDIGIAYLKADSLVGFHRFSV